MTNDDVVTSIMRKDTMAAREVLIRKAISSGTVWVTIYLKRLLILFE